MSVDKLRETHHINRVAPSDLGLLMSAQSYRPEITQAIRKIKSFPWAPLQSLVKNVISPGPHPAYGGAYPCLKTKNVNELLADLEPADFADVKGISNLEKVQVERGDLLINLTGAGSIGRVSIYYGDDLPITNQHIARMGIKDAYDEGYVAAFLRTWWGERALEQGVAGSTGQINMVNDHVRSIPVIIFNAAVQKYIGDKVRQAERLRAWAKECECKINAFLDSIFPNLIFGGCFQKVPFQIIGNRLDAEYYKKEQLGLEEFFSGGDFQVKTLSQLSKDSFSGAAIPSDAFGSVGVPVLQTKDINEKGVDLEGCVRISEEIAKSFAKFSASYGSIIMGMSGTVGRSSLLYKEGSDFIINQRVSAIKILDANLMGYVCFYLNHKFGKMQMSRRSVGGVQANISLGDILTVKVVIPKDEVLSDLNKKAINVFTAIEESKKLTSAAKLLVESLIEGQLTEAELIAAEHALQAGNDQLDRRILNRLKTVGVDGQGPALFGDLDELYQLLTQAEGD